MYKAHVYMCLGGLRPQLQKGQFLYFTFIAFHLVTGI